MNNNGNNIMIYIRYMLPYWWRYENITLLTASVSSYIFFFGIKQRRAIRRVDICYYYFFCSFSSPYG